MKYEIIGWTRYNDTEYDSVTDGEKAFYLRTSVINEIRNNGYRFPGCYHADAEKGYAPVFNNGEKLCVSEKEWGAIMAQALYEDNSDGMAYSKWTRNGYTEREYVFPQYSVDKSLIAKDNELEYEPLLDEEYYNCCSTEEQYEQRVKSFVKFIEENNVKKMD